MSAPVMHGTPRLDGRWKVFGVAAAASALGTFDTSAVTFGIPAIARGLHSGLGDALWVMLTWVLAVAGLSLIFGRVGDVYGRKPILIGGILLMCAGVTGAALSESLGALLAARAVECVGGAMVLANINAIAEGAFPAGERGRVMGYLSVAIDGGLVGGPLAGGLLTAHFGWHGLFLVQIPASALTAVAAWRFIPSTPPAAARRQIDYLGAALLFVALTSLVLALNRGGDWGWVSTRVIGLFVASALSAAALVPHLLRTKAPIFEARLFRRRPFAAAALNHVLYYAVESAPALLVPIYLLHVLLFHQARAGALSATIPLGALILSPLAGKLSDRLGARVPTAAGMAVIAGAIFLLATLGTGADTAGVLGRLLLLGAGCALFLSANKSAILGAAPAAYQGTASAMIATTRCIGQAIGLVLATAILVGRVAAAADGSAGSSLLPAEMAPASLVPGIRTALVVAAVAGMAGIALASQVLGRSRDLESAPLDAGIAELYR